MNLHDKSDSVAFANGPADVLGKYKPGTSLPVGQDDGRVDAISDPVWHRGQVVAIGVHLAVVPNRRRTAKGNRVVHPIATNDWLLRDHVPLFVCRKLNRHAHVLRPLFGKCDGRQDQVQLLQPVLGSVLGRCYRHVLRRHGNRPHAHRRMPRKAQRVVVCGIGVPDRPQKPYGRVGDGHVFRFVLAVVHGPSERYPRPAVRFSAVNELNVLVGVDARNIVTHGPAVLQMHNGAIDGQPRSMMSKRFGPARRHPSRHHVRGRHLWCLGKANGEPPSGPRRHRDRHFAVLHGKGDVEAVLAQL